MWSTDGTKLYIPNTTAPSFGLRQTLMESDNPEAIDYIPYTKLNDKDWLANLHPIVTKFPENDSRSGLNGSTNDPATGESRPTPFAFPCTYDLDESVITHSCDETVEPSKEKQDFGDGQKIYLSTLIFSVIVCQNQTILLEMCYMIC